MALHCIASLEVPGRVVVLLLEEILMFLYVEGCKK